MSEPLDLVMPLILAHWGYFKNFLYTYDKNWHIPGDLFILARINEIAQIKQELAYHPRIKVVCKEDVIGPRPNMLGPYRAMASKIGACELVSTSHYMIVDADCLIMHPLHYTAQLKSSELNHPRWIRNRVQKHRPHFYASAAEILNTKPIPPDLQATGLCPPAIYSREVSEEIISRLRAKTNSSSNWAQPLDTQTPWGPDAPWAEVFLHDTMAFNMGQLDDFVFIGLTSDVIDANKPWNEWRGDFDRWSAQDMRLVSRFWPIAVVHSFTGISPEDIWEKVKDHV